MRKYFNVLLFLILLVIIPINIFAQNKNSDEIITGTYQFSAIEGSSINPKNSYHTSNFEEGLYSSNAKK